MVNNKENQDIGEILDSLIDNSSAEELDLHFLVEALAMKLTRRQALIVRLMLLGERSRKTMAQYLGCSAPMVSIEIYKIKKVVVKLLQESEGRDYSRFLIKLVFRKKDIIKEAVTNPIFNIEGDKPNELKGPESTGETKKN